MLSDPHEYFPHLLWQTLTRNLPVRSINYTGLSFQLLNTNLFLDRRQKTECTPSDRRNPKDKHFTRRTKSDIQDTYGCIF